MAGAARLYLYWDPAIDGAFRRRMERALGGLKVDAADGDMVDPDPDNPAVVMALASAAGGWAMPARADIVVQSGPGEFPDGGKAFRLEAADIEGGTARWTRLVDKLRSKLGMASLALEPDELALKLDEATRRADEAERAMATARLNESNAIRERNALEVQLAEARAKAERLEAENARLARLNDAGAYALGLVPADLRGVVAEAREHAWRAQAAAARAAEMAAAFPGAIAWGGGVTYSGEHRNGRPDGYGVMSFSERDRIVAFYRGQFVKGQRNGFGVGLSVEGQQWSGAWKSDAACGAGVLEARDGKRFEGQVTEGADGGLKVERGWTWNDAQPAARKSAHHAVNPRLPAPQAMAD